MYVFKEKEMFRVVYQILLLVVVVCGFSLIEVFAQQPIRGEWSFNIQLDNDMNNNNLWMTFVFRKERDGIIKGIKLFGQPRFKTPISYQEENQIVNITYEGILVNRVEIPPNPIKATFIIRGTKQSDIRFTGKVLVITDQVDSTNPLNLKIVTGVVNGIRLKLPTSIGKEK